MQYIFFIEKHKYDYFSDYINSIVKHFNNKIIIYQSSNIQKYILEYSNNSIFIFLQEIPNYINKFTLKNYFILNTEQYTHCNLIQDYNKTNNLIDYSKENIIYANNYLNKQNIYFFPYTYNKQEIYNYDKIYDACIVCNLSERRLQIINEIKALDIKVTVISNLFDAQRDEILFRHKILINIHNSEDYKIFESIRCNRCIFNKMIIISENSIYSKANKLSKYIIFRNYNNIAKTVKKILDNYNYYYNLIYTKYDNLIQNYNNYTNKIYDNNKKYLNNNVNQNMIKIFKQNKNACGFIIIRNVIDKETNIYWQECFLNIRKFYDNKIIIIDDNSNKQYLICNIILKNCKIINSKYKQRGELLGYYYLHKYKLFDKAVIIHDSVFIKHKIDFFRYNNIFLWEFSEHMWDEDKLILKNMRKFKNKDLLNFYLEKNWQGCFGIMSVINLDFLQYLNKKFNFFDILINNIKNRNDRMALERIFGCLLYYENKKNSILGDIQDYCEWGITYDEYKSANINLPVIKIWYGR